MQRVTIFATMRDGLVLVERAEDFGQFVRLALGFRKDPDCVRLVWHVEALPPPPTPPAPLPASRRPALAVVATR